MHIQEDHFIPEIINPDTGEVLPEGEIGELVFTCIQRKPIHYSVTAQEIYVILQERNVPVDVPISVCINQWAEAMI